MTDPSKTPELNLKPRRAASAQSAARAYGSTQAQAAPAQPMPASPAPEAEAKRGFLAANWPLMTAAAALMAGGVAMGMAVGGAGPAPQPATVVATVAPRPLQTQVQTPPQNPAPAAAQDAGQEVGSTLPRIEGADLWRRREEAARRPAVAPPPPPAALPSGQTPAAVAAQPEPQKSVEPAAASRPQQVAAVTPPPAYSEQNAAKNGSPQAWRARAVAPPAGAKPPFVAILIDDAGLDRKDTARAIALPGPITLSFMTYANELAAQSQAARAAGHELMLHMPMEPLDLAHNNPGPNALLMKLDTAEIQRRLDWDLARFDGYVGVNNHMGSRFTRDKDRMGLVMAALRKRQVFWLDSLSGPGSMGTEEARHAGLDAVERDLFLDDSRSPGIAYELAAMERIAKARGDVVAIGHPHPVTLAALEKWIATAKERGFSLVPVSTVLLRRQQMER
jgi:polysaccharide deacetylase 2 family uncharacterized protein YibQ